MPVSKVVELNSGHKMPILGLGTGKVVDEKEIETTLDSAIEIGYRLIDTAFAYKNEAGIGSALQKHVKTGNVSRNEIFVVTKLPLIGMHPSRVEKFANLSLKNLQLDYIDLYLIHWPVGLTFVSKEELMPRDSQGKLLLDINTNLEDVWKAMEDLVDRGVVRSIGLSNFNASQIKRILSICRIPPASLQVELHARFQQVELQSLCKKHGIVIIAYAPLGSQGRSKYINAHKLKIPKLFDDPVIKKIAASHDKTSAQVLLRFLIQGFGVAVIPKSISPIRLKENYEIFDFELSSDEIERIKELDEGEMGRSCLSFDGAILHPECPFAP